MGFASALVGLLRCTEEFWSLPNIETSKAWCLLIHAEASLCLYLCVPLCLSLSCCDSPRLARDDKTNAGQPLSDSVSIILNALKPLRQARSPQHETHHVVSMKPMCLELSAGSQARIVGNNSTRRGSRRAPRRCATVSRWSGCRTRLRPCARSSGGWAWRVFLDTSSNAL